MFNHVPLKQKLRAFFVMLCVAFGSTLAVAPQTTYAASSTMSLDSIAKDMTLDRSQQNSFISALRTYWVVVANGILFVGLAGAVIGLAFGGGMQWIRWGVILACFSAFGEPLFRYLLKLGGVDVLGGA